MTDEPMADEAEERIAALERQVAQMRDVLAIVIRRAQATTLLSYTELKQVNDFVRMVEESQGD